MSVEKIIEGAGLTIPPEEGVVLCENFEKLEAENVALKDRITGLESIILSDDLALVLKNYMYSTLVPRHHRICESLLKIIEKEKGAVLNSVAVRDSGCSVIRAPLG